MQAPLKIQRTRAPISRVSFHGAPRVCVAGKYRIAFSRFELESGDTLSDHEQVPNVWKSACTLQDTHLNLHTRDRVHHHSDPNVCVKDATVGRQSRKYVATMDALATRLRRRLLSVSQV